MPPAARRSFQRGVRFGERVIEASADLSRRQARYRTHLLRTRAVFIAQCSLAATAAYALARYVFDVEVPLFAPVAAMICLGMSFGARLSRAAELTLGVAVGVLCGELFVQAFGMGVWQVFAITSVAMAAAAVLRAGTLGVIQSGVQGLIVALLAGDSTTAFGRWFEALIGAMTALVFGALAPASTFVRPRATAAEILERLAGLLLTTATGVQAADRGEVERALERARGTEADLDRLRGQVQDAVEITTYSPVHWRRRGEMREIAAEMEPMDRSVRNARVLIRRAAVSLQIGEELPADYLDLVLELAAVTDAMAHFLGTGQIDPDTHEQLAALARESAQPDPQAPLSAEVVRAQVRSMLVDYHMILGRDLAQAQRLVSDAEVWSPRPEQG